MSDLHDVVIYSIETKMVDTVAGRELPYHKETGQSATKRLATVLPRLNDRYDAAIVPTGKFPVGSVLANDQLAANDWSESKKKMAGRD